MKREFLCSNPGKATFGSKYPRGSAAALTCQSFSSLRLGFSSGRQAVSFHSFNAMDTVDKLH